MSRKMEIADLFCGAGGTSTGAMDAIEALGYWARLTAINHWDVAIATHSKNHPEARHLCTSLDNINPRDLYRGTSLDVLWASPECTHHSIARGGKPINDQSRATAWCVVRWAEALRPRVILVENVPEFASWGALGANGKPLKSRSGGVFRAWVEALRAIGYRVEWRVLCAADYGDPTTRRRLFVQAVRGRLRNVWPLRTHGPAGDMPVRPWVPAREIIDWSIPGTSLRDRRRPLSEKTMARILAGLKKFGLRPFLTPGQWEEASQRPRTHGLAEPLPTVCAQGHFHLVEPYLVGLRGTSESQVVGSARGLDAPVPALTAGGGHIALCEPSLLPQQSDGVLRPVSEPVPTVATAGAIGLVEPFIVPIDHSGSKSTPVNSIDLPLTTVTTENRHAVVLPFLTEYYGNGGAESVDEPLNTVTTKQRFGLVMVEIAGRRYAVDIRFRMLQPHELAAAQGFPRGYEFTGTKTDQVKQIGNAVPCGLARALVLAVLGQDEDIEKHVRRAA